MSGVLRSPGLCLVDGRVFTLDAAFTIAEAIGLKEGRIAAIGTTDEVKSQLGRTAEVVSLQGATVLPGLIDIHAHLTKLALQSEQIHIEEAHSLSEALKLLAGHAEGLPPGTWLSIFAEDNVWRMKDWPEARLPMCHELDRVAPKNPVFFPESPELAAVNTSALEFLSRLESGGDFELEDGLIKNAETVAWVKSCIPVPEAGRLPELIMHTCSLLTRLGTTSIVDPGRAGKFEEDWKAYQELRLRGDLALRTVVMNRLDVGKPVSELQEEFCSSHFRAGSGDEHLRVGPIKLILDGEIYDALMRNDYPSQPGFRGNQRIASDQLRSLLRLAHGNNSGVCIHTVGGGASDLALEVMAEVFGTDEAPRSWPGGLSLGHVFFPSPENLDRCRTLGVWLAIQPPLLHCYGDDFSRAWGDELASASMPLRTMSQKGIRVAAGTDVWPPSCLYGIWSAIERKTRSGQVLGPTERLPRKKALRMYTIDAACAIGEEHIKGSLEVGKLADLIVLEDDLLVCKPEKLPGMQTLLTMVGGQVVFQQKGLSLSLNAY